MTIDTARLRALAEAATPGEWRIEIDSEESHEGGISYSEWTGTLIGPENAIPSRWAIARGETNRIAEIGELRMEDAAYIAAANPQTMIALLDELKNAKKSECTALCRDVETDRDALQARIDAALEAIEGGLRDPIITPQDGYQYGFRNALHLVRAALSTPTENGEEQ